MKVIQIVIIVLIGTLLVSVGCTRTTPTPITPPVTPPAVPPAIPPATPPVTPPVVPPVIPPVVPPTTPPVVQGPYDVWITGRDFNPSILRVPAGTKVTWTNKDGEQHTISSNTGLFGPSLSLGGTFSYTFTERGTYNYHCDPHPDMIGVVIVE